jgi:hypothetical protein
MLPRHFFVSKIAHSSYLLGYSAAGYIRECVNPHGSRFFTNFSKVI